jgi:pimeloyl-ACP methyl ester carboxylesterase
MWMQEVLGQKKFVQTPNGNYAVWQRGKGPLVLLLHGWPVTSYHWRYLVPYLSASGFETIAIDLKGLGESTSRDAIFDKPSLAQDLWTVISHLKSKHAPCYIVGHDWGGSMAIAIAALNPGKVAGLVVEDEVAPGIEIPLTAESAIHYPTWHGGFHRSQISELLIEGREESYINFFLDLRFRRDLLSIEDRKRYLSYYMTKEKTANAMAYYRAYSIDAAFYRSLVDKKLELPGLTIAGRYGMGASVLQSTIQIAPHSQGILFDESAHYPAEEEPDRFNAEVVRFFTRQQTDSKSH